jgi:zinc protease
MRTLALLLVLAACHPHKPAEAPVPVLPGEGDANVAKPPATPTKSADDPWAGKTDLIAAPAPQPPRKLELPRIDEVKLSNGLDVFVIQSDRLPVVSMQLAVRAGRMHEPRARLGVAEATADMLVKGTKRRDAMAIAKAIDFVGGTITADSTYEVTHVSCSVLARNLGTCLDLLPEMITQPSFSDEELTKVKDQMLGQVRQRLDDADSLASLHAQNLLWGNDHVRGWADSEQSVSALHRDDIIAFHKTWYVPNNAMLVVAGDVDTKKLKGDLERAFGSWKKGTLPPAPTYHEPGLSGIRIRLVDKPGQTQTHIRIGQFGIKHDDPRFFDTLVWNYALGGGGLSSRMNRVVRVDGGKAYGVQSAFDRNFDKGSFVVSTFTRNAEAVATTKLLVNEIAKMAKDGPSQEEIDAAIANIAGSYGLRFQGAADLGGQLLGAELHGFGLEYLSNYPLVVGKVDLASARQAASEILDPHDYVIVMVGDAKDLEPQLKKEGWHYEKVTFSDPITPEIHETAPPADAKAVAAAKKLLDDALAAKGGKKIAAMKSFHWSASGTTMIGTQSVPVDVERTFVVPDKMRIDATLQLPGRKVPVIIALDGKTGWNQQPTQNGPSEVGDLQGVELGAIDFERWREPELILLKATDPAAKVTPSEDETIDGQPQSVVRLQSPVEGLEVTMYLDKKTKLITRLSFSDGHQAQSDDFADYRDVNGIKIAFKRKSSTGPRITTLELSKFELDPKVDPSVFAKPSK